MQEDFIYCEIAEKFFGKTRKAISHYGDVSVDYLTNKKSPQIDTGAREYQREKVASLKWKQQIMLTVLSNAFLKIPQVHIRVIKRENAIMLEVIDGQQRITSIIDFVNGDYRLGNGDEFNLGNGIDLRGMDINDIKEKYNNEFIQILDYRISCVWYENLTDEQTADLFINILNNVNTMKPQENRNAIRGKLSEFIRNSTRFVETRLSLFDRVTIQTNNSKKKKLKNFSDGFNLSGRMEVDEWLSELVYMLQNGYRNGVSQTRHTTWVTEIQSNGGDLSTDAQFFDFKDTLLTPLLKFAENTIISVPSGNKHRLTPMLSQLLILYGYELKNKYGQLDVSKYVSKFFDIHTRWSCPTKKLYLNHTMWSADGKGTDQLQPFNKLFNGKNKTAFQTITKILDIELKSDFDSFGVTEIDTRKVFTKPQIIQKWEAQERKCFFTGEVLELKDIAGDHYIPRSWGIKRGGVTEMHNLVVTSKKLNLKKSSMHGDDFITMLNMELNVA